MMKTIYAADQRGIYQSKFEVHEPYPELAEGLFEDAPPHIPPGKAAKRVGDHWELVPNYAFLKLWSWDGEEFDYTKVMPGMTLDELQATDIPPPDENRYSWDMKTMSWVHDAVKARPHDVMKWETEYYTALNLVAKPIAVYQDEITLGKATSMVETIYKDLVSYRLMINKLKPLDPVPPLPKELQDVCISFS